MEDPWVREDFSTTGTTKGDRVSTAVAFEELEDGIASVLSVEEKTVRWDRFLPRKFVRVLLVENDDSTRHIVSSLLRKCCYKVAAVADGLKAWEVLKEKHYNFDIVLTEVVMPSLSGISLLSKIMSNEICKNIPVIMMSSHDSTGIVFQCMLKGAADFLVKPIRKNELKNLWQHVWKKYCSIGCGMGSENRNLNQARVETVSDNVAAINHGNSNVDNGLKTADSSDKESHTQSSFTKREAINGNVLKLREAPEHEYRNFMQEIHSKSEKHGYDMSHEKGKTKDKAMGIDITVSLSIQATASTKNILEANGFYDGSPCREEDQTSARSKEEIIRDSEHLNQNEGMNTPSKEIIDFIGLTSTEQNKFSILKDDHAGNTLCKNENTTDVKRNAFNSDSQLWELSLRGPQHKVNGDQDFQEKHVLNHSHASAFSRYGGGGLHVSCPTSGSSSSSLCNRTTDSNGSNCRINQGIDEGKSIPFPRIENLIYPHRNGVEALIYSQLSGRNKEDAGPSASVTLRENACVGHSSTEKSVLPCRQVEAIPLPLPVGALPFQNLCAGYGAILQPIFCPEPSRPLNGSSEIEKARNSCAPNTSAPDYNHLVNGHVNSSGCFEDCRPHLSKKSLEDQKSNIKTSYPSVMFCTYDDQIGNCSRGITDASGCNGNDDTSAAVNPRTVIESGNEDGFQICNGEVMDHCSQREAALARFRLKRKDRCFEKKVRYHSRKKLAEQRPRLKGQFVCQAVKSARIVSETDD